MSKAQSQNLFKLFDLAYHMNEFIFSLIKARIRNEVICTLILILICVRNSNNGFVYAVVYLKLIVYTIANAICDIVFLFLS